MPLDSSDSILDGPIPQAIVRLAAPSVVTMLVQSANGFLDSFFIGGLDWRALAASGVGMNLSFLLMSAAMAVTVGTGAIVARSIGARNLEQARDATRQSLVLIAVIGVGVMLAMLALADTILHLEGLDAKTFALASPYLKMTLLGMPFQFVMLTLGGAIRGLGDTVRPFYVTLGSCFVHALFNYLLIFGNLGFPRMGLTGGAVAMLLSQLVAALLFAFFLPRTALGNLRGGSWRLDPVWAKRLLRIGLPAAGQQVLRVGSMTLFQTLIGRFGVGSPAIAALNIGLRSESLAFMPGFGYSMAAAAFVGQNLGAKQPDRAKFGAWQATFQAVAVMSLMGVVFYVCAEPFARLFIRKGDPAEVAETIELAVAYLRIVAIAEPFLALGMVLTGALQGAGETRGPTILTAITMVGFRLPLAAALLHFFGIHGAWLAMAISTVVQGIGTVILFRRGTWLKQKV